MQKRYKNLEMTLLNIRFVASAMTPPQPCGMHALQQTSLLTVTKLINRLIVVGVACILPRIAGSHITDTMIYS